MEDWTKHPAFELAAAQMSMLYRNTGDEKYARYAILILGTQAENYDKVPVSTNIKTMISEYNPFTYNNVYDSPSWDALKKEKGKDYRAEVERVFEKLVLTMAETEAGR